MPSITAGPLQANHNPASQMLPQFRLARNPQLGPPGSRSSRVTAVVDLPWSLPVSSKRPDPGWAQVLLLSELPTAPRGMQVEAATILRHSALAEPMTACDIRGVGTAVKYHHLPPVVRPHGRDPGSDMRNAQRRLGSSTGRRCEFAAPADV